MVELEAGLSEIRRSPRDRGRLELIVCRPAPGDRKALDEASLDLTTGLIGDNWLARGKSGGRAADPERQLTIMNSRVVQLLAGSRERWPLAGDQLYIDLDLTRENLPPGTRLFIGLVVIEITAAPHTGCSLFMKRFGADAVAFLASPVGNELRLRGVNARVITPGIISVGTIVAKAPSAAPPGPPQS